MPQSTGDYALSRLALATAYWLRPPRTRWFPYLVARIVKDRLSRPLPVPSLDRVQPKPPGLAGLASDLGTDTVLAGFRGGFYLQSHWGAMKWWSPPVRAVMLLDNVHIAKRFRRTMRGTDMRVAFDTDFSGVLDGCAAPRGKSLHVTWITPRASALYERLFAEGHAHSVEIYDKENRLVGGLFGVAAGPVFSALSMFHTADNASKFAIISLYHHLEAKGFMAVDHQVMSGWVSALGGIEIPREDYVTLLDRPAAPEAGRWSTEFTLEQTADWQPANRPADS